MRACAVFTSPEINAVRFGSGVCPLASLKPSPSPHAFPPDDRPHPHRA
jgi:hypothetical protein